MSELESVQRDPDGRVFSVGVEGRALYYLPRVIGDLDQLRADNERLREQLDDSFPNSWAGFRAFLDEQYPDDVFPDDGRDLGPSFVVATRRLAEVEVELAAARRVVQAVEALHPEGEHRCPGKPVEWIGYKAGEPFESWTCATRAAVGGPGPTPEPAPADALFIADDAFDDPTLWRPNGEYPVPLLCRSDCEPEVWALIVNAVGSK